MHPLILLPLASHGSTSAPAGPGQHFQAEVCLNVVLLWTFLRRLRLLTTLHVTHFQYPAFRPAAGYSATNVAGTSTLMVSMHPPGVHAPSSPPAQGSNDVIAYYSNYAITESSNCTQVLAGARVANAVTLEYNSRPTLAFAFNVRFISSLSIIPP